MLIPHIPYVRIDSVITESMSACLAMVLNFYHEAMSAKEVADLFEDVFFSREFHTWNMHTLDQEKYEKSETMTCAQYLINRHFEALKADIISTSIGKVRLSYIKRTIPLIVTGKFPLLSGWITTSVLLTGYVDDFYIVNDPRGNANSGYHDRFGEHMLYHEEDLARWITSLKTNFLRIVPRS